MFTLEDHFDQFWAEFPKKVKKPYAKRCFLAAIAKTDIATMLAAIGKHKRSRQWLEGFIPNPATWLNNEEWNDELEEPKPFVAIGRTGIAFRGPVANEAAVAEGLETRRRRAEMHGMGMTDEAIEAVFEAEYEDRRRLALEGQ